MDMFSHLDAIAGVPALHHFSGRRVLLLQGPMGPFLWRFAKDLRRHGAEVFKINFNGGDWLFYPRGARNFRGTLKDWPAYLKQALKEWRIDVVIMYGDCRPVHEAAIALCERAGIEYYTFEEGYLRGDYITFERGRTNGYSAMPRTPIAYMNAPLPPRMRERKVGYAFFHQAAYAVAYHVSAWLLGQLLPVLPPRTYHRGIGWRELFPQLRGYWRRLRYAVSEAGMMRKLTGRYAGRYFLVPLQVALDSQITRHSPYAEGGVPRFIREVVESFARHAPQDAVLVFKHHPLDRGYNDYGRLIRRLRRRHGLRGRLFYIHDQKLAPLFENARGVVVINSTTGISALFYSCPVKVMGDALYDMKGLTAQVDLDDFWREAQRHRPDARLFHAFRSWLIHCNQVNGNFYRRLPGMFFHCGLNWPVKEGMEQAAAQAPASRATWRTRGYLPELVRR